MKEISDTKQNLDKTCPLLNQPCHGSQCALWIDLQKPIIIEAGDRQARFLDPYYELVYRGCGLIHRIPWERTPVRQSKGSEKEASTNE